MAFNDVDKVLDYRAKQTMISWSLTGFKRAFPRLYRAICYAMDDAHKRGRSEAEYVHGFIKWIDANYQKPIPGIEVIGYSEKWIDLDFNIRGTRSCFIDDQGKWTSAKWNDSQDSWHTHAEWCCEDTGGKDFNPTHWISTPIPPQK